MNLRTAAFAIASLTACASPTRLEPVTGGEHRIGMSLAEATEIVEGLEYTHYLRTKTPTTAATSMEEAFEVLRSDQIDRFRSALAFAEKESSLEGMAMAAQLELAWGEAQFIMSEIGLRISQQKREETELLERKAKKGKLTDTERKDLEDIRKEVEKMEREAEALRLVSREHVARGAEIATEVIEDHPDSYLGYRVAADFYRLQEDWARFDEMMMKIEATNPGSNGLVFLRGVDAAYRRNNHAEAERLFRRALKNDPRFVRAQVHLALIQDEFEGMYRELNNLKTRNPEHQIVVLLAESLERSQARIEARRRALKTLGDRPWAPTLR